MKKLLRYYLFLLFFIGIYSLQSQTLNVISTGQTTSPGTNWSLSGSTLTVTGTANIRASVIVNALANGNLTVVGNTNNFAVTVSEAINATTAGSGLTIGSMTNTGAITVGADITLAGGIAIMGGDVQLNGNITSTATGDLFFQGLSNAWSIRLATGKTIEKTSGMGLLTLQGNGRINNSTSVGSILASGLARLDVVIINEMDAGSAGLYNVSTGNITTNGGHLWIGAGAKTQKWNGLDVGTTGVPGNTQYNGIDVTGNISTNGGDVFLWAYVGSAARSDGYGDIVALTTNRSISAGSGDITLMTRYNDFVDGSPDISISTTGTLTLAPASGSSFDVGLSYAGTTSSGTFTGSGGMNGLIIQDVSNLSGLVIGSYNGTGVSGDSPYTTTNTANVTLETAISIAGPVSVYGGDITISQNLTSSLADADILLQAIGAINLASSKTIETSGGDVTLRANAGGAANTTTSAITLNSGSSLLSNGGNITLGGNFDGTKGTGLYAASAKVNGAPGVLIIDATLDAAGNAVGGNINIYGRCSTSHDDGIRLEANISTMGAGSIGIYGDAYGGLTDASPDLFYGGITFITNSSTIETENGNINVEGVLTNTQSNGTYALNFYRSVYTSGTNTRNIQIISKTGDIQITGDRGTTSAGGMGSSSWGNIYFGSPLNNSYIASGDIKFSYSSFVGANVKGFKVKTTGAVTYEPSDTSFVNAQTFPYNSYYTVADGASSLTIGKASNIANITMNAATTVAGPITVYGGTITLNANLTTTNYGDISLYTDNALGGLSVARTINASGSFNYIPRSDFFSAPVTYPISNLNLTSSGLLIGKPSNTANITFGSATSIAGPITAYGGTITLNADLTTSNASSISLLAKSGLRFSSSGITLQTSGGDVLLSGDHDANSSGNIIAEGALTITSNGGAISMGGGATGSDFAYGIGTSNTIANDQTAGIWVRGAVNLNSGNGNISIRGYAANASPTLQHVPSWGVGLGLSAVLNTNPASVSINSGTGTILIEGYARNPNGLNTNSYGVVFNNWETTTTEALTITSGNTTANAIRLIGNTENTQQGQRTKNSLRFWSVNNNIRATGIGGGITLSGKTFDGNDHPQICWSGGNILATSGPIVINSENEAVEIGNDLYLGSRSGLTGNTSSSSNIRFSMDDFSVASGVIRVASTGSLTIEPFGSSFTDYTPLTNTIIGFTADTRWSLNENAQTLTGLTIGKTTNTANITMAASTTVAGPITVYGGDIAIDENLNTTAGTTSGNVLIKGSGDLILAANKSITTSGAPVVLWAN
ncbi:MAG: hypothetical protein NWQ47_00420, partial [Crocinitomicaceae bacterium]|nr:hypothetical protein [Crocinitomicaceae bacterium]